MIRGGDLKKAVPHSCVDFYVAALGTGATPPVKPADGNFTPTTATYPLRANGMSSSTAATRASAGVYTITVDHQMPNWLFATAVVVKAGGSPTAELSADVTVLDSANKQITVKCIIPNGTATDLGTSDMLLIKVEGQNSTK